MGEGEAGGDGGGLGVDSRPSNPGPTNYLDKQSQKEEAISQQNKLLLKSSWETLILIFRSIDFGMTLIQ